MTAVQAQRWRDQNEQLNVTNGKPEATCNLRTRAAESRDARPAGTPDRETSQPRQLQHPDLGQDREPGQVSARVCGVGLREQAKERAVANL